MGGFALSSSEFYHDTPCASAFLVRWVRFIPCCCAHCCCVCGAAAAADLRSLGHVQRQECTWNGVSRSWLVMLPPALSCICQMPRVPHPVCNSRVVTSHLPLVRDVCIVQITAQMGMTTLCAGVNPNAAFKLSSRPQRSSMA